MIFLFIIFVILSVTGTLNAKQEIIQIDPEFAGLIFAAITKCMAQTKLDPDVLQKAREGVYTEDDSYKKFLLCAYQEAGYAYPNGRINAEKAGLVFPEKFNVKAVFEECDMDGIDPIETIFNIHNCFHKNSPVILQYN